MGVNQIYIRLDSIIWLKLQALHKPNFCFDRISVILSIEVVLRRIRNHNGILSGLINLFRSFAFYSVILAFVATLGYSKNDALPQNRVAFEVNCVHVDTISVLELFFEFLS